MAIQDNVDQASGLDNTGDGAIQRRLTGARGPRYRPRVRVASEYEEPWLNGSGDAAEVRHLGTYALPIALLFLALILGLQLAAAANSRTDLGAAISGFSVRFLSIFIEAAPFLLLGAVVSALIEVFIHAEQIARIVPNNRFLGVVTGTFLGFAFPVCECGVVPVVRRLLSKRLPVYVGVAFLLAAPVMNPVVLLSTLTAFGFGPVLVGRFAITAAVAVTVSLLFAFLTRRQESLLPAVAAAQAMPLTPEALPSPGRSGRLRQIFDVASDEFFEMGRYLIIGCLLAASLQTLVGQDVLLPLGQGPVVSVIIMQALAFVLSVCSTVDAFIALAFTSTFATGSILAFLTFGPMVDIKSTLMFLGVFRRRAVALLLGLPFLMTLIISITWNLITGN